MNRSGIGRQINLAVRVGFLLVLMVGGVSVLLAWAISREVEQGRRQGLEVEAIDRIHSLTHHFVSDFHLFFLQGGRAVGHQHPKEALRQLTTEVAAYEALERAQGGAEASQELMWLDRLKSLLARLEAASLEAIEGSLRARPLTAAELAVFNELSHEVSGVVQEIHALHRKKFERTTDLSQRRLLLISGLYVTFGLGGALLLLLGNRFLFSNLVLPIARLAQAALHIASGDFSQRVPARSGNEVGQLSRAFNLMAERLEAHEAERVSFEAELERQVKERTRELEETAERLQATQAELVRSERIAVTGQIAAGVTHEIRTPLNSLVINVQLLRRELSGGASRVSLDEALSTLATVEYETIRINRILEEFVKFARLPAPRFERVQVGPLLDEILALLGPQATEGGVRIQAPRGSTAAQVTGDPDQLREVFLNLGQNALQAMPNGGAVDVEVSHLGEWIEIAVADSGPGVPEAERERIFLPFVTTRTDGLGLGLAIVRRIVEEHGGSVSCQSRVQGGTVFLVRLPAAKPA